MDSQEPYELTLNVTNEQEEAIKAFFAHSGWDYIKVLALNDCMQGMYTSWVRTLFSDSAIHTQFNAKYVSVTSYMSKCSVYHCKSNSWKLSPSTRIRQQCAAHGFAISGIYSVFAVSLIWIVQNYLQLLWCLVISIIAIPISMVSRTMSSPNFNLFWIDWPAFWQSHLLLLAVFYHFILREICTGDIYFAYEQRNADCRETTCAWSSPHLYISHYFYCIADIDLTRLHRVQNQLASPVTKSPPFTCSLPLFCFLHWLPVKFRILLKINLWRTKSCMKNSLSIFTPCLPHHFHSVH